MTKQDYYTTLNISNTASQLDIKRAYKKLAIKYHPDRNQGNKTAEEKFKKIKQAYEILSDTKKRNLYDQYGHSAFEQNNNSNNEFHSSFTTSTSDFNDIFGDVFGDIFGSNKKNRKEKGSDLQYNIILTLEEAVKGIKKEIRIPKLDKCQSCYGYGSAYGSKPSTCTSCNGHGQIHMRKGFFSVQQTCSTCRGTGTMIKNPCKICFGQGRIKKSKKLSITIPAGIDTNDQIRLNNEGEAGKYGAKSGDLYIQIKVKKHPIFKRDENNLHCKIPINFVIAGGSIILYSSFRGEITVPTLEGKINLKIPSETQSGKIFRIRGKGVKSVRKGFQGDLFCKIIVETPVNLNSFQKKILYQLGESFKNYKGENNSPKSKRFFNSVKKFFNNFTK
ncbi:molecular chaperone DnaJ [Buchnera aphidicola]|uniref:Chaperone protein DnaJ n=1 Tax=Buchnera aphidicola subsp. Cinara cedri (strain Cc) TaxID=372461 RepID=DNAJ_BUCCC|nr:molecular chaperone DnaJ [Buchnera aphidicola]Q057X7.1 RecName: Full=Chaperone protein DnaJ [Buchnera aphidicola BCc]ABJ90572.1 Hsp70 co-chaperone [Buchnera aphidicola BCc]